jgi:hypothetical protein
MSGIITDNIGRSSGLVKAVEAAGGAWTHIVSTTLSGGVSTVDFVNGTGGVVLDTTYPMYRVVFDQLGAASTDKLIEARITEDAGSTWETGTPNLNVRDGYKADGSTAAAIDSWNDGEFCTLTAFSGTNDLFGIVGFIDLYGVGVARRPQCNGIIAGIGNFGTTYSVMGCYNATFTMDGIQFICDNGSTNLDSGTISIYGLSR